MRTEPTIRELFGEEPKAVEFFYELDSTGENQRAALRLMLDYMAVNGIFFWTAMNMADPFDERRGMIQAIFHGR